MHGISTRRPIKVGVIADQTGPLSFMGIANANVAKMVIDDINATGGLLGRQLELHLEDSATDGQRRGGQGHQARPAGSGRRDLRWHLQLHAAGHQGSRRGGGQDALHLPGAVRGTGVRPAHLLHRPGAGAAGRAAHSLADAADGGEEVLPAVSRLHLAARAEREGPRGRHGQRRRDRRRGVLPPRSRPTTARPSTRSCPAARRWCSTRSFRPGSRRSSSSSTTPASRSGADTSSARTSTRTS